MANEKVMSKTELLTKLQDGWRDFSAYLKTLTEAQLTTPHDAAGWTVKDHLIHLVAWEDGVSAILSGQSRTQAMGIDKELLYSGDYDKMNAEMQQRDKNKPLPEVLSQLQAAHEWMMAQIQLLADDDLKRSRFDWEPEAKSEGQIINLITGNSCDHYEEHKPWIDAIAKTPF